jgi:hypothetical protein
MKFESSIHVTNSSERMLVFHLEPWGEQIEMPSGARFLITAEAEQQGSFELEHGENEIVVWAWSGAVAKVFCDGKEIGVISGVERLAVPSVPEGQSVSSFLRSMLGKDGEV